jgi:hypothetical protein
MVIEPRCGAGLDQKSAMLVAPMLVAPVFLERREFDRHAGRQFPRFSFFAGRAGVL